MKWINAEKVEMENDEGELEIVYKDNARDFSCSEEQLPQVMLQELMIEKLGFTSWDIDDVFIEYKFFKNAQTEAITPKQESMPENKPWWKLW